MPTSDGELILMVTGHRPNRLGGYRFPNPIEQWVRANVRAVIEGYRRRYGERLVVISGMAQGADTIFLEEALGLGIKAYAAIPFEGQEGNWPASAQERHRRLLNQCAEVFYVCEPGYAAWKMFERNHFLVERANFAIAVWDGSEGGTGHTVDLILEAGIPAVQINPSSQTVSRLGGH